jgi:hypothetical protein
MTVNLEPKPRRRDRSRRKALDLETVLEGFERGMVGTNGLEQPAFVINTGPIRWLTEVQPYMEALNRLQKSARKRAGGKT